MMDRSGMVVLGASLGGGSVIRTVFATLPPTLPWPIAAVQHRGPSSGPSLATAIRGASDWPVVEPDDKEPIRTGVLYLAPANYHLLVGHGVFHLSIDGPVAHARPSIDVLFESASAVYGRRLVAVALSASSRDGMAGAVRVRAAGGRVVVQDPETAESPVLPRATRDAVTDCVVLPPSAIGPFLSQELTNHADRTRTRRS